MAVVTGILTTENAQAVDDAGEWQSGILVRNGGNQDCGSVLFPVLTKLSIENADNHSFNWFERNPTRTNFFASAAFAAGATVISFSDNANGDGTGGDVFGLLSTGTVLRNFRTNEAVLILNDPTAAAVAVVRGAFGTTAAAVVQGDIFVLVTKGSGEDGKIRRAAYEEPETLTNYVQRFDETVRISDLFAGDRLRSDARGALPERRLQAAERIAKDIELAYFDGYKGSTATADGPLYTTGGIRNAIETAGLTDNIITGGGPAGLGINAFQAWLETVMLNGTQNKIIYCGPKFYSSVSHLAGSAEAGFRFSGVLESLWGMHIQTIKTPHGDIDLCLHPLFKESQAHRGSGYIVDLGLLVQKNMSKLELYGNCENPERFGRAENFRAILGLKLKNPTAFGYCANLQNILPE
jgi:hypothetical protein